MGDGVLMPAIRRLSGDDGTNLLTIGRKLLADIGITKADVQTWLQNHPTATLTSAEVALNTMIDNKWPNKGVDVYFHVFSKSPLNVVMMVANQGTVISDRWWA